MPAASDRLAAVGLGLGRASSVAALPPLQPNNTAELWPLSCLYGPTLASGAARVVGWSWNVSNPAKPGFTADAAAAGAAGWQENALALRVTAHSAAMLSYVAGWDAGAADVTCEGDCACAPMRLDAWRARLRVTQQKELEFSRGGADCRVVLRAVEDSGGRRGFKLVALTAGGPGLAASALRSAPEAYEGGTGR